jgi:hypothetical protein
MAGTGVLPFLRGVDFSGNDFKVFFYFDDTYIVIYILLSKEHYC